MLLKYTVLEPKDQDRINRADGISSEEKRYQEIDRAFRAAPTRITDNVKMIFNNTRTRKIEDKPERVTIDDFEELKKANPERYVRCMTFTAAAFEIAVREGAATGIIDVSASAIYKRNGNKLDLV